MNLPLPGFFGKIPMTGDFIHRRINPVFLNRWDEWLKRNIAQSQYTLGDNWLDNYLTSPMWRFMLAPGIIDKNSYAGVMIPSVDSVGRYFPLTLVQQLPNTNAAAFIFSEAAGQWFHQMEDCLLDMLEGYHTDANSFDEALKQCQASWTQAIADTRQFNLQSLIENGGHFKLDVQGSNSFNQSLNGLMLASLMNEQGSFSIYWQQSANDANSSCLISNSLPSAQQYTAFLDGSWQEHGWQQMNLLGPKNPPKEVIAEIEPMSAAAETATKAVSDHVNDPLLVNTNLLGTPNDDADAAGHVQSQATPDALQSHTSHLLDITKPNYNQNAKPTSTNVHLADSLTALLESEVQPEEEDITLQPGNKQRRQDETTAPGYQRTAIHSYGFTDTGNYREHNEDSLLLKPSSGLWVVADGMGGHQEGAHASRSVVEELAKVDVGGSIEQVLERIRMSLDYVNQKLLQYMSDQQAQGICGSTVVGLIIRNNQSAFFWAGDSRIYLYRNQQLTALSKDHSFEQEQIDQGIIAEGENCQGKNLITRAVGGDQTLALDVCYHNLQAGDKFLLCSDGVYNEISLDAMQNIIASNDSIDMASELIKQKISAGPAKDNFTSIIVSC